MKVGPHPMTGGTEEGHSDTETERRRHHRGSDDRDRDWSVSITKDHPGSPQPPEKSREWILPQSLQRSQSC